MTPDIGTVPRRHPARAGPDRRDPGRRAARTSSCAETRSGRPWWRCSPASVSCGCDRVHRRGAGRTAGPLFSGMIATDGFALFFKGLVYLVAFFGVILGASCRARSGASSTGSTLILLLCLAMGMGLLAAARNLLMLYLALEMVSLPSYVLTGFRRGDRRSSEAAREVRHHRGGLLRAHALRVLAALRPLRDARSRPASGRGIARLLSCDRPAPAPRRSPWRCSSRWPGSRYKIAAVPFHMWCPDVYEGAPTPFTAFLSVGPKAAGMAALLRFFLTAFGAPGGGRRSSGFPWPVLSGDPRHGDDDRGEPGRARPGEREAAARLLQHRPRRLHADGGGGGQPTGDRAVMLYLPIYLAHEHWARSSRSWRCGERTGSETARRLSRARQPQSLPGGHAGDLPLLADRDPAASRASSASSTSSPRS